MAAVSLAKSIVMACADPAKVKHSDGREARETSEVPMSNVIVASQREPRVELNYPS